MIIEGDYDEKNWYGEVRVDGKKLDPKPSQKVMNHSPDGFAWGYGGSGPAQLALAVLLAEGLLPNLAIAYHQRFKSAFFATLPRAPFRIEVDIVAWIQMMEPLTILPSESEH